MQLFTELDLSPSRVRGYAAGLRPYRRGCPRLEVERRDGKVVGHNYGHGGSGITMSWGSAAEVLDMLAPWLPAPTPVAVLGAGIVGLCVASLLQERGHQVTVYARQLPPDTTSNVAGGLWAPTHVGLGEGELQATRHQRILRRSWHSFLELDPVAFGVENVPLFEADNRTFPLDPMPDGLVDPPQRLDRLPFSGCHGAGQVSRTLVIETPRLLQALLSQIRERGGQFELREFRGPEDLCGLEETVMVDCLGLGAGLVAPDPLVVPIRGQLVLLDPAPRPFFYDHADGYVISRRDVLILGGTFEEGVDDPQPDEQMCTQILEKHRRLFKKT